MLFSLGGFMIRYFFGLLLFFMPIFVFAKDNIKNSDIKIKEKR